MSEEGMDRDKSFSRRKGTMKDPFHSSIESQPIASLMFQRHSIYSPVKF